MATNFHLFIGAAKKQKKNLKRKVNISHKNSEKHDGCEKKIKEYIILRHNFVTILM